MDDALQESGITAAKQHHMMLLKKKKAERKGIQRVDKNCYSGQHCAFCGLWENRFN
jgi:hypothetical protein